jgi:hypothetical protein
MFELPLRGVIETDITSAPDPVVFASMFALALFAVCLH